MFISTLPEPNLLRSQCDKAKANDCSIVVAQECRGQDCNIHERYIDEESRLLSLPKELRLRIWTYVLADPAIDRLYVCISCRSEVNTTSCRRFCNSLYKHTPVSEIDITFRNTRSTPINVNLLSVSHRVYLEALPILYDSTTFCPWSFDGIFPVFLDTLSDFAKSHIRYIRLDTRNISTHDTSFLNWVLTCAQIAKLSNSLRLVEVSGHWPIITHSSMKIKACNQYALFYPLLKIKAPKKFVSDQVVTNHDAEFQLLMDKAAKELKIKSEFRKVFTARDAAERARQEESRLLTAHVQEYIDTKSSTCAMFPPLKDDGEIARELSTLPGTTQFEEELSAWDLVSIRSSKSPAASLDGSSDDKRWTEAASTIVVKEEDSDVEEHEEWTLVKTSPWSE